MTTISRQVPWLVPGEAGDLGLHVPRAVAEEPRPGGDFVTVRPRHTVVQTVRIKSLRRDSVTLNNVSVATFYN